MDHLAQQLQLRGIQQIQLDLLLELDRICKKNQIPYQLFSGTLLGSIRHQGFIPWDDDIDLCMMRSDYDRFLTLASKELPDGIFLQTTQTDPEYLFQYAKLRKIGTRMIESKMANRSIQNGIFIDIFPFDRIPNNVFKQTIQRVLIQTFRYIVLAHETEILFQSDRIPKALASLLSRVACWIPKSVLDSLQNKFETQYNSYTELPLCHLTNGVTKERIAKFICTQTRFEDVIEGDFENHRFQIPRNYDDVLHQQYGDYLQLPPIEKRMSLHRIIEVSLPLGMKCKPYRIGYTAGVFDFYHYGHQALLKRAKELCDILIVGINSDELTLNYKGFLPSQNEIVRTELVRKGKEADAVFVVSTLDKVDAYNQHHFGVLFIGDDWKGHPRWNLTQKEMENLGVDVIFLPYTPNISSSMIRQAFNESVIYQKENNRID